MAVYYNVPHCFVFLYVEAENVHFRRTNESADHPHYVQYIIIFNMLQNSSQYTLSQ